MKRLCDADVQSRGERGRLALARLVRAANAEYYALVPLAEEEIVQVIAGQLGVEGTEQAALYTLASEQTDRGLVTTLDAGALDAARQAGSLAIMRRLPRTDRAAFVAASAGFASHVEPLREDGLYLPTVAVAERGAGVGTLLMTRFLELRLARTYLLHVHRENRAAIALYGKLGFTFASDADVRFRAMRLVR